MLDFTLRLLQRLGSARLSGPLGLGREDRLQHDADAYPLRGADGTPNDGTDIRRSPDSVR